MAGKGKRGPAKILSSTGVTINTTILRVLYQERGFTQPQVAEKIGVSVKSFQNWLWGKCNPSPENFEKICEVLQVAPAMLEGTSQDQMIRGKHALVMRFYTRELIGENEPPTLRDAQSVEQDLNTTADRESAEEDVRQEDITVFSAPESSQDTKPDPDNGDAVQGG